jgi:hypothetical protein
VKYNHLDGELQVWRDMPIMEASVIHPQDLWASGQWIQVCAAAVVATQPGGDKTMWPHWKQKMTTVVERVVNILSLNGALTFHPYCMICSTEWFSIQHLLGPKHFRGLVDRVPEKMPVQTENYFQFWNFTGSSMAYNHVTGTLIMMRRSGGNEPVAPSVAGFSIAGPPPAVMPQPRPPPPPPQTPPPQPATSSTVAPPEVDMQLASHQQQSASSCGTYDTFAKWTYNPPAKLDAPAKPHTIGTQQAPEEGLGAFRWFWQKVAAHQAPQLEEIVVAALDPLQTAAVLPYCELCQCRLPPSVSFAQHVSTDIGHMTAVLARFEEVGPDCRGWVQCWPGVAEFNHLNLDVVQLIAREGGSENSAAVAEGRASAHEVDEQLCAAVQPVTGDDAEDQQGKKHADPLIVSADITPWKKSWTRRLFFLGGTTKSLKRLRGASRR